ncbi:cfa cyclopropane-fatty-acyl-phospholipid synthase [Thermotomaculum hydrothermale]|uniref:Cfa cyclopropane-fatty-acyl-phospholipid synthase n=1 Tax=Thermotomaculum hydrothermale TaxID=981385 RepID=A0A7R6PQ38_9BACT|nr:cyclopropane-fatty-acyl-phospholipid synthase family protein [Thermotomaculum hydrothermale]BBB33246.1 cfa cyclopropane-fatty-acyl-phospholipid synthase [Thermotomaculum hydrothermale]
MEGKNGEYISIAKDFLAKLLGEFDKKPVFVLWNGEEVFGDLKDTIIKINFPWSLREMFIDASELSLAESYVYGDIDIEGNIYGIFPMAEYLVEKKLSLLEKASLFNLLRKLPKRDKPYSKIRAKLKGEKHSKERDAQAISYHYDVSNEFYKIFLDKNLQYSCAYFQTGEEDINTAQIQKMDYICKKLYLKEGERLLDIGAGWGGLIIYAAKNYGVYAKGITLSKNQYEFANEWIKREGLEDRVKMEFRDYRDLDENDKFDKIVSVGMFEHVGEKNYSIYMKHAYNLLKEGGLFLNHGITINKVDFGKPRSEFIQKYVFPDGELLPISLISVFSEDAGFEIRDIEQLREHYSRTTALWVKNLEENAEKCIREAGKERYRVWRLYLAASSYQFAIGKIGLYQTLLVKPEKGRANLPWTRKAWYY